MKTMVRLFVRRTEETVNQSRSSAAWHWWNRAATRLRSNPNLGGCFRVAVILESHASIIDRKWFRIDIDRVWQNDRLKNMKSMYLPQNIKIPLRFWPECSETASQPLQKKKQERQLALSVSRDTDYLSARPARNPTSYPPQRQPRDLSKMVLLKASANFPIKPTSVELTACALCI